MYFGGLVCSDRVQVVLFRLCCLCVRRVRVRRRRARPSLDWFFEFQNLVSLLVSLVKQILCRDSRKALAEGQ
jgi:hypothetical protein